MTFVAGPFTAKLAAVDIGQVKDVSIETFANKQLITGDNQGSTPQDAIFQGMEVFVSMTLLNWDTARTEKVFWPYHATEGTQGATTTSTIGKLDSTSGVNKALELTAIAGTTAACTSYNVLTVSAVVLAEGFPVKLLLGPVLREVPVRFRAYPTVAGLFYAWS